LDKLTVWQPKRIFMNGRGGGTDLKVVQMEIDGNDPVLGISFAELAGRSRAMHKTQGFGNFGGRGGGGPRSESFQLLDGEPASKDILENVNTNWNRFSGGEEIGKMADEIIAQFDPQGPAASVPALMKLRSLATALTTPDPVVSEKRAQLDHIIQGCLGLSVKTVIPEAEVVPGEKLKMRHTATVSSAIPVRWVEVRYPGIHSEIKEPLDLRANQPVFRNSTQILPAGMPLTGPYWHASGNPGMFQVDDPSLIGRPESPVAFPIEQVFEVSGQTLIIPDEPVQVTQLANGIGNGEAIRRMDVIPPVSLGFGTEVAIFTPRSNHSIDVEVTGYRAGSAGTLRLEVPDGWRVEPEKQPFRLATVGEQARLQFAVTAPAKAGTGTMVASAEIAGVRYSSERVEIRYPHIPIQLLQPPARLKMVCLDLAILGRKIGYLPGAGDSVDECLKQMGYSVTPLTDEDLTPEKLHDFDAVVIGVRAFNVRTNLAPHLPGLFAYVEAGGTVVAQYNRPENSRTFKVAPYDLKLSQERVTDENAVVTFLAPNHPVLNTPNKITEADFSGWIQERGIYYPNQWDEHFTPILASGDPGESPLKGGLLVAPYGKGHFVYTGLVFFRELPAGVPGAYRLFANLVSLGKSDGGTNSAVTKP
jgi:hypothetical protein